MNNRLIALCSIILFGIESFTATVTRHFDVASGLSNNYVHGIADDSKGRIWIATEAGLNCFDGYKITVFKSYNSALKSNFVSCLYHDKRNSEIWVGVKGYGIYRVNDVTGTIYDVTPENIPIHNISDIAPTEGGLLFFGPSLTVKYDDATRTFEVVKGKVQRPSRTGNHRGIDKYNNVWEAVPGRGVSVTSRRQTIFTKIIGEEIWCLLKDKDVLWAGGENHCLYRVSPNGSVETIPVRGNGVTDRILSICKTNDNTLLLASSGKLIAFDMVKRQFKELLLEGESVFPVTFFHDSKTGITWITTLKGIYSLRWGKLRKEDAINRQLRHQQSNGLRVDNKGRIWIGTFEDGLFLFDRNRRLISHQTQQKGFFTNSIMHLRLEPKGKLWLATPDGVGLIDTSNPSSVQQYGYKQGLIDPFIRAVCQTPDGNAWVATNNGLAYLDTHRLVFYNFSAADAVPTHSFTGGLIVEDDRLFFTSTDGLFMADAKHLLNPGRVSQVKFLGVNVMQTDAEQTQMQPVMPNHGLYSLSHNQNNIRITFAVEDKMQCPRVDYSYRILGLSDEWVLIDDNVIDIYGMQPGDYTIEVRARLHGQPWEKGTVDTLSLQIRHPWWATWPMRIVYLLAAATLLLVLMRYYQHRIREKNEMLLEKRQLAAEKENNRERLQFFTNVTHELRTPLTLIFGPIGQLEKSASLTLDEKHSVGLLRANAERLLSLVNKLLDFRKVETHNRKLCIHYGRLDKIVEESGNEFAKANRNNDVAYKIECDKDMPELWFDSEVLKTVLTNLLSNAMKNTARGEISLSLSVVSKEEKDYTCIKISDTGRGIPHKAIEHIFDRYYQGESNGKVSGTGIGLSLVKALCKLHKIDVSVQSQVGVGTTFTLLLENNASYPDAIVEDVSENRSDTDHADTLKSERKIHTSPSDSEKDKALVLVVEDNNDINNFIAENLSKEYVVIQASNGEEGLRAAQQSLPNLIICDIMMPVMDGITMTRNIKNGMTTSHIPVIMLTAKTAIDDRQEGYESGADSYLTKPFCINILLARVHNILDTRRKLAKYILDSLNMVRQPEEDTSLTAHDSQQPALSRLDRLFMDQLNSFINHHIADPKLNLDKVASELSVSQSTLYRKTKALLGVSTNEYIRKMRLIHACKMMLEKGHNVSQAAFESGFTDLNYFREIFKKEYGITPNEYLRGRSAENTKKFRTFAPNNH